MNNRKYILVGLFLLIIIAILLNVFQFPHALYLLLLMLFFLQTFQNSQIENIEKQLVDLPNYYYKKIYLTGAILTMIAAFLKIVHWKYADGLLVFIFVAVPIYQFYYFYRLSIDLKRQEEVG